MFVSGREISYSRNTLMLHLLEKLGHEVDIATFGGETNSIVFRTAISFIKAAKKSLVRKDNSIIVCGFYGHMLVILLKLTLKKTIIFDAFVSTFDTLCNDRNLCQKIPTIAALSKWIDQLSCSLANEIIVDTVAQKKFFISELGANPDKIHVIYAGCNENIFYPYDDEEEEDFVLFYSSFLPLHGLPVVMAAAEYLQQVKFRIIGPLKKLKNFSQIPPNVEIFDVVRLQDLPRHIAKAKLCLGGHFGGGEKAKRVIASKTFECMSMAKPVIVGINEANSELFTHGIDSWFCEMNNPIELAKAISYLMSNDPLRRFIASNARKTFIEKASSSVLARELHKAISRYTG
ncbi:MAG: hypothetical protein KatS3mg083_640 [Candidatus Dojkabacteria bacterium]|nr:MAG: hypothetical protein KatS3mg083_640 [Candidatus Dojkabacteria bacterium]